MTDSEYTEITPDIWQECAICGWYVFEGKHLGATDKQRGHTAKPQDIRQGGGASQ